MNYVGISLQIGYICTSGVRRYVQTKMRIQMSWHEVPFYIERLICKFVNAYKTVTTENKARTSENIVEFKLHILRFLQRL